MNSFLTVLLFFIISFAAYSEQGSMSPDDSETSDSEASLSGYGSQEEVLLIEEEEVDPLEDEEAYREEELYLEEEASDPLPSNE